MLRSIITIVILTLCFPSYAFAQVSQETEAVKKQRIIREHIEETVRRYNGGTAEEAKPLFKNKTHLSYSAKFGTQVEYIDEDGRAHLWYPGYEFVAHGWWELTNTDFPVSGPPDFTIKIAQVCFAYPIDVLNPETGGASESMCSYFNAWQKQHVESMPGDIFDLKHRKKVPFIRDMQKASLSELREKTKKPKLTSPVQ